MNGDATYLVVYHEDHGGEPLAMIRTDLPGNHATEIVRALKMAGGRVETSGAASPSFDKSDDMATLFGAGAAPAEPGAAAPSTEPGSTNDPDAMLRAETRARLEREARAQRIEAEVRAEMEAEQDGVLNPDETGQGASSYETDFAPGGRPGLLTSAQAQALADAGFHTANDIRAATDEQLDAVEGIGTETVKKLREATQA